MKFTHLKTPLNKYTFKAPKIKAWVTQRCQGYVLNLFAGETLLDVNEYRNDIRENMVADSHMDALEFCKSYEGRLFNTIILDPPYAFRKSMEMYEGAICSPFNRLKDAIIPLLSDGGKVITFGYHSVSMGAKRGFYVEELCIMSHGGAIHDTIATIERRAKA
jgi:tRNA G10  N-methylase Trm11